MYTYQIYDTITGRIMYSVNTPISDYEVQYIPPANQAVIAGEANQETQYIDMAIVQISDRPDFTLTYDSTVVADLVAEWVVTGIPGNTVVTWPDGVTTTETDGQIEFSTDTPGFYTFRFELFPYKTLEVTVEAVAGV